MAIAFCFAEYPEMPAEVYHSNRAFDFNEVWPLANELTRTR
jgi:hypothetical protein